MAVNNAEQISVLFIAYPEFNTLDINGPLEVLGNYALRDANGSRPFRVTIAAIDKITTAYEGAHLERDISIQEAAARLSEFDILIQPGGAGAPITKHLIPKDDGTYTQLLHLSQEFVKLGPSKRLGGGLRIAMSICTGALFWGYAGIFAGLEATTHFQSLDSLRKLCKEFNDANQGSQPTTVVPSPQSQDFRYVKVQTNPAGCARVISSGGISCGIDATLYLVALLKGRDAAVSVAYGMEYAWREMP